MVTPVELEPMPTSATSDQQRHDAAAELDRQVGDFLPVCTRPTERMDFTAAALTCRRPRSRHSLAYDAGQFIEQQPALILLSGSAEQRLL
jgi:hypothetical protein